MHPVLYYHPFSSYSQKVLIALYENGTPFERREFGPEDPTAWEELVEIWPVKRFPMLKDRARGKAGVIFEASTIIEYLQLHYPGPVRLIPEASDLAIEVRMLDRLFDNYISTPQQAIVFDALRKRRIAIRSACRRRATCSMPPICGWKRGWVNRRRRAFPGRWARVFRLPTAPPRRFSSMRTGRIRSAIAFRP